MDMVRKSRTFAPTDSQLPRDVARMVATVADNAASAAAKKALGHRLDPTPGIEAHEPRLSAVERLGLSLQAKYARGVGEWDPVFPATARKSIITLADRVTKNAQTTAPNLGGSLFPPGYSNETIEAIREKSLLVRAGARPLAYPGPSFTFGRINSGASLGWTTELGLPPNQDLETDDLTLQPHFLKGYIKASLMLLRTPSLDAAAALGSDMLAAAAQEIDKQFLVGDGTNETPVGFVIQLAGGQAVAITATPTPEKIRKDLANAVKRMLLPGPSLADAKPAWFMSPDVFCSLAAYRDSAGVAFPSLETNGSLYGAPVYLTNAVGDRVVFAAMDEVLWGSSYGPEVHIGMVDADLVSMTQTMVLHFVGDCRIRHQTAASVITGTNAWAAL